MSEKEDAFQITPPFLLGEMKGRLDEQGQRIDRQEADFKLALTTVHTRIDTKHKETMESLAALLKKVDGMQKWIYGLLLTGAVVLISVELGVIKYLGERLIEGG